MPCFCRYGGIFTKFDILIRHIEKGENIPDKYQPHPLRENFSGYKKCHIETDLLLIRKDDDKAIYFVRTGSHSDIFERTLTTIKILKMFEKKKSLH